jgi:hypothetical protein
MTAAAPPVVAKAPAKNEQPSEEEEFVWVRTTPRPSQSAGAKVKVANTTWVEKTEEAPKPEYRRVKRRRHHPKVNPPAEAPVVASAPGTQSAEPAPKPPAPVVALANTPAVQETPLHLSPVTAESVPSEEELLGIKSAAPKGPPAPTPAAAEPVPAPASTSVPTPTPKPVAAPASTPNPVSTPKPLPAPILTPSPTPTTPVAPPAAVQAGVPSTEELLAVSPKKSGPDTTEGDAWVPKAAAKPVVAEPAEPPPPKEPMKVAMAPGPVPVDNSVENLLKIAGERQSGAPRDSDAWVPQKTSMVKPDVDIDREVTRIRAQENQEAAKRKVVRLKRDINNPEEGVLPVSSFEKFSGPMYGRHREYERRFVPGRKQHAKVPDHDFYVDEVDRKKEVHNVYYYAHQKGKGPKLVAVERHETVSFLGNYDIEKEDKGKISTYN